MSIKVCQSFVAKWQHCEKKSAKISCKRNVAIWQQTFPCKTLVFMNK